LVRRRPFFLLDALAITALLSGADAGFERAPPGGLFNAADPAPGRGRFKG